MMKNNVRTYLFFFVIFIVVVPSVVATSSIPVTQLVVYNEQTAPYTNFHAAIIAQGQLGIVSKLPSGSQISLYLDGDKVVGPTGLASGARCNSTQLAASYYQNTVTLEKRFCPDLNDAILDGKEVYGIVPDENVFLHKIDGTRCSIGGNGGEIYLINPASLFYRNYYVNRSREKLTQHGLNSLFIDDLQNGWGTVTGRCGGNPQEYSSWSAYEEQMVGFAQYVKSNLPEYRIEGNLSSADANVWDKFAFLDGVMCESCFSDWSKGWPTATRMLSDLSVLSKWTSQDNKRAYVVIWPPTVNATSNLFAFTATLLTSGLSGQDTFYHFGAESDYGVFRSLPEYTQDIGIPTAPYVCNGTLCSRQFERAKVEVNFANHTGKIVSLLTTITPTPNITGIVTINPTVIPTTIPTPQLKPGDITFDGFVNSKDHKLMLESFGKTGDMGFLPADIDKNGKVDIFDYNILVTYFGK